jgi:hypothetical protein
MSGLVKDNNADSNYKPNSVEDKAKGIIGQLLFRIKDNI